MRIIGYFKNNQYILEWIKIQRQVLPDEVVLTDAGVDEGKVSERGIVDDPERFEKFVRENKYGFFLFNRHKKSVSANIIFREEKHNPHVSYHQDDKRCKLLLKHVHKIIESYTLADAVLAFAYLDEEREYKNRVKMEFEIEIVEAWVGRDIKRYLPGIYWINWISDRYAEELKLSPEEMAAELGVKLQRLNKGSLIQLGEDPKKWRESLEKIKKYSMSRDNIFYVDKVDLTNVKTYRELSAAVDKWE